MNQTTQATVSVSFIKGIVIIHIFITDLQEVHIELENFHT